MSLEKDPLIIDIKFKINEKIKRFTEITANGGCSDYIEYKKFTSKIAAFKESLLIIDDSIKSFMRDDE